MGSGKHASADGTRWDLYEQNLLSEYHIRYGGYGGIGYYHVSDTYIALFSHFIPCGVWEAVYILDGLLKNESDIQPDVLHADTQGQSEPVFALAHLLGIELMPRSGRVLASISGQWTYCLSRGEVPGVPVQDCGSVRRWGQARLTFPLMASG
jgi:TnpA family transposase